MLIMLFFIHLYIHKKIPNIINNKPVIKFIEVSYLLSFYSVIIVKIILVLLATSGAIVKGTDSIKLIIIKVRSR